MKTPTQGEIFIQGVKEVFWTPFTWVPLIPSMAIVTFCYLPWWANTLLLAAPAGVVATYWAQSWPRLANAVRAGLMSKVQEQESTAIQDLLNTLVANGHTKEARAMSKAHDVLAEINKINSSDPNPASQALRIGAVAQAIFDQMRAKARAMQDEDDSGCLASFQKSLKTMQESLSLLQRQAEVLKGMDTQNPDAQLEQLEATLRAQNTIANNVIDRVEQDTRGSSPLSQ